jgi:sialate O-acetylesterase
MGLEMVFFGCAELQLAKSYGGTGFVLFIFAQRILLIHNTLLLGSNIVFCCLFTDHMVLQAAPQRSTLWGYADPGSKIVVTFAGQNYIASMSADTWSIILPSTPASHSPYVITIADIMRYESITVQDVLFGDVFICSGQSNMAFLVDNSFNGSQAVQDANNYPNIRLFTASKITSDSPLSDYPQVEQPWSVASNTSVSMKNQDAPNDDDWLYFSAVCWFTAKALYEARGTPLGMLDVAWGGTYIEVRHSNPPECQNYCFL